MTEISAFLGVRPRAGPPRNSLQARVESSGLSKTRCRLRIDLEPASIWGMSDKPHYVKSRHAAKFLQTVRKLDARLRTVAQRTDFRDFFCSARLQAAKFGHRATCRGVFARSA